VARAAVEQGIYTAALIIPEDFTQRISYLPMVHPVLEQTGITVYANRGSPIASEVVRSIAEGITNQIAAGNIAMASSFEELQASFGPASLGQVDFESAFGCAFSPAGNTVGLNSQTVEGSSDGGAAQGILVFVGSAQAMFFALFTAQFGVLGLHNERRQGTLQRMVVSPTPRSAILAGNLGGVFLTVVFQLLVLILALTLVGSLLQGKFDFIWGDNLLLLAGLLLSVALAVSGFGILLAAIVRSPEQGNILAPITNMALGVLGGAFGFTLPRIAGAFSLVYWGREAFQKLAEGDTDIGLNLLVLVIQGALMYLLGVWLFNRRFEVA
jgi:ABC-2 type transport system permease protein